MSSLFRWRQRKGLVEKLLGMFEELFHPAEEGRGGGSVHDLVVHGQAEGSHLSHSNFVSNNDGFLCNSSHTRMAL